MPRRPPFRFLACWLLALSAVIPLAVAQPPHEKNVWNYDGGVFLETDGAIPGGACFRVKGRLDAPSFFENLKREDTASGTLFRRGNNILTEFPRQLELAVTIFDIPCDSLVRPKGERIYLTDAMVRKLSLSFFWKRELKMRPLQGVVLRNFEVGPIPTFFDGPLGQETKRYAWLLKFEVPSDGVPLTDSLVLILRSPDHHIVARTAARL